MRGPALREAARRELGVQMFHGYPLRDLRSAWPRVAVWPRASAMARELLDELGERSPEIDRLIPDWSWAEPPVVRGASGRLDA